MKKKMLCLLLAATMATGMLTGCGGGNDKEPADADTKAAQSDDGGSGSEEAEGLPPMTDEEIELTYMNFDNKVLTEYLADKFEEKYPNIKVNIIYEPAGGTYNGFI